MCNSLRIVYQSSCLSIAPADVSHGLDRTLTRFWDPISIRRLYSWLWIFVQDAVAALADCLHLYTSSVFSVPQTLVVDSHVTSADIFLATTVSPGPILVLLVSSVLFVL